MPCRSLCHASVKGGVEVHVAVAVKVHAQVNVYGRGDYGDTLLGACPRNRSRRSAADPAPSASLPLLRIPQGMRRRGA